MSLFKKVDALVVKVPDIEKGINFYSGKLGLEVLWKKDDTAALRLGETELVLSTKLDPETDILVESVSEVMDLIVANGGEVILAPEDIPVGKVGVVKDPFGNVLTLVDLSKGRYDTDVDKNVTRVNPVA